MLTYTTVTIKNLTGVLKTKLTTFIACKDKNIIKLFCVGKKNNSCY